MNNMTYGNFNPVNIDDNRLLRLGFNTQEIQNLHFVYNNGGKFTPAALQSYGYNYEQAKRLSYMFKICEGKVSIESKEETIKHLRKLFGQNYRIGVSDLAVSKITNVPRVAVVDNIVQEPYDIWNSKNYKGLNALYRVIDVSGQKITIETRIKPRLEYGKAKALPGILEIKGIKANGNVVVTFDKKYCCLCNRFVIVTSLRNPEFHNGKYEILCFEGTRVYVYATNMGVKDKVKYSMSNQRIYDYGIFPKDIKPKLDNVAKAMYNKLYGVTVQYESPNSPYKVVDIKQQLDESDLIL